MLVAAHAREETVKGKGAPPHRMGEDGFLKGRAAGALPPFFGSGNE